MSGYHTITEVIHGFAHLRLAVESDPLRYRAQDRVVSDSFAASGQKTTVTVHALFMQVTNGREPSKRYQHFSNTSASQIPALLKHQCFPHSPGSCSFSGAAACIDTLQALSGAS